VQRLLGRALVNHGADVQVASAVCGALWTLTLPDSQFARELRAAPVRANSEDRPHLIPLLEAVAGNAAMAGVARDNAMGALGAFRRS
jgi:hypothetical protein